MSNSPSLHWRREGSIFRSEPEESSQGHVAGRQRLKNYCERMQAPDRCVDHCVLCDVYIRFNYTQTFFPHIQGFKSNQGSHVILVALICSINIEPFRKNRESKKLNLALGLRVTSNSATLKFTREEPPSGLLTLRMPEPTVDPTNY